MRGGSLTLLLEPRCSKLQRGACKLSNSEEIMIRSLSNVSGVPLLYFKVGSSIYISLFLAGSSCLLERALRSCQSAGPAPPVGSGGSPSGQFSWAMANGSSCSRPIPVGRDGLLLGRDFDGCPVSCPSVPSPHVPPCADLDLGAGRLLMGA